MLSKLTQKGKSIWLTAGMGKWYGYVVASNVVYMYTGKVVCYMYTGFGANTWN